MLNLLMLIGNIVSEFTKDGHHLLVTNLFLFFACFEISNLFTGPTQFLQVMT